MQAAEPEEEEGTARIPVPILRILAIECSLAVAYPCHCSILPVAHPCQ